MIDVYNTTYPLQATVAITHFAVYAGKVLGHT